MVKKNSGMAVASLVLGLLCLTFLISLPIIGQIIPLLAIVFGFISLKKIKKNKNLIGKGFAITGIIFGTIFVLIFIYFLIFVAEWASYLV